MKKLLSTFIALGLVLTLAACGEKGGEVTPDATGIDAITAEQLKGVEIELWSAQGGPAGEAIETLTKKFNETNEYGIVAKTIYQGSYVDTDQKAVAALTAGKYPNLTMAYGNNIERYRASGKVVAFDDYFKSEKYGLTTAEFNDIYPAFREESSAFNDGKFYSLPIGKSAELLFYNVDFFEEHGFEVPTTLDETLKLAKEMTAITGKPSFGYDSLDNLFITYLQQLGGEYTDASGEILFRDGKSYDAAVELLTMLQKAFDEGVFTFRQEAYMSDLFTQGNLPMFVGSTSGAAYIKYEGKWASAQIPMAANPKVMQQGAPIAMLDNGPVENLAAYLFMEFLIDAENTSYYAMNSGYVPVVASSVKDPAYSKFINSDDPLANTKKVFAEYDPNIFIYDAIFQDSYAYRKATGKAIEKVTLLDMDPKQAVDELIKDIDAI